MIMMSILILPPWTLQNRSNLPSSVRSVTLSENLYHQPTVPDTGHQASDFWWDGTEPWKTDQQRKTLFPTDILSSPHAPLRPPPTFKHKFTKFSTTMEYLYLTLSHIFNQSPRLQNTSYPHQHHTPSTLTRSNLHMSISPRITTQNNLYRNQRFHETEQLQHKSITIPTFCF